jgi:cysteine synthase A
MAESFSVERRKLLRFLGAKVVLTPAAEKGSGMLAKAVELARAHGWFLCRQFENEANADVHSRTTAREILADFSDEHLDYFVTGFGTGGTLKGVARELRRSSPKTKVIAAEPDNSQMLGSGIAQPRDADGAPTASHPRFRPHVMQGWAPDFISRLTEDAVASGFIDEIVPVAGDVSMRMARELARQEGIFVGTSSGATLTAALEVARRSRPGTNIVCMLPDTGERYLSTPLFADIGEQMTDEELAISRSTPACRFDVRPAAAPQAAASASVTADIFAKDLLAAVLREDAVVLFALEWCEFSWAVRTLFTRLGIAYRDFSLDSAQHRHIGDQIRAALAARTGAKTIPQIFIAGEHIGGCTEVFDAWREGWMRERLNAAGVEFDAAATLDPYDLLPKWLQPREVTHPDAA